jgi:hypothetical protein
MDLEASNRLLQGPRYGKYLTLKTNKDGYSFTPKKKAFEAATAGPRSRLAFPKKRNPRIVRYFWELTAWDTAGARPPRRWRLAENVQGAACFFS